MPIVITERWRLPFEGLLDYSRFSGSLPLSRLEELPAYARSLDHARLLRGALQARHAMRYDLGRVHGGKDMLPLLIFEMWRRLRAPLPAKSYDFVQTISSGVDDARVYLAPGDAREG